jgi:hypothetical protein
MGSGKEGIPSLQKMVSPAIKLRRRCRGLRNAPVPKMLLLR